MRAQICRVHIVPGHLGDETGAEKAAQGAEDQALVALLGDVVEEDVAQHVAGERGDAAALVPGGFAGAGEADGEDDIAARGFVGHGFGAGGGRGEGFGLGFVDELLFVDGRWLRVGLGCGRLGYRLGYRLSGGWSVGRRGFFGLGWGRGGEGLWIRGPQGCGLVRRYLLPNLARGLRFVRTTLRTSSHECLAQPIAHSWFVTQGYSLPQTWCRKAGIVWWAVN